MLGNIQLGNVTLTPHAQIGQQLRRIRKNHGISLRKAAEKIFGSQSKHGTLCRYETGKIVPTFGQLKKMCNFYGVDILVLLAKSIEIKK